ncbi:LysR family transcriptional regulator [Falsigemmobacter intermedius]|uniref:LysR family transcriptional regulator n=1 Tax=Falsigemmobacter intermedius TaxID=1553448 RepID=A0A3S3UN96_9RHOB|nr:LysR family transcriptional regulator [Falsigemmobacter intermedius]
MPGPVLDTNILQTYVHVVEEGSFAAAARRMGISRSQASKYIADLEADLGTRLLQRSTRSLRMTDLGQRYYDRVRRILEDLRCANEDIREASSKVAGRLRIGVPKIYMMSTLQPVVSDFMLEFPEVTLDLVLTEGRSDLHQDGLDAAIMGGRLPDSTLFARRLHTVSAMMVASPAYLAEAGAPAAPEDLAERRCLHHSLISETTVWPLMRKGEVTWQRVNAVLQANNWEMLRAAALSGQGISVLPESLIAEDLAAGRLVQVLVDHPIQDVVIQLVYADARHATAALKAFIDFLTRRKFA